MVIVDDDVTPAVERTVDGLNETKSPEADGGTEAARVIDPVNPTLPSETTELAEPLATKLAGLVGPAEIVKSGVTVIKMTCDDEESVPLVPVTMTLYEEAVVKLVVLTVRVEVTDP